MAQMASGQGSHWLIESPTFLIYVSSSRQSTLLSPTASTLCSGPCAITVDFDIDMESGSGSDSQTQSACTVGSSFPVVEWKLKRQANHDSVCTQSSKFILFFCSIGNTGYGCFLIKEVTFFLMFQCITVKNFKR